MTADSTMFRVLLALKPLHDFVKDYDRSNTYRPDHPASVTLAEGITFQHAINAHDAYEELMNS